MHKELSHHLFSDEERRRLCKNSLLAWIRARTSFALLRSELICLRGSIARIKAFSGFKNNDINIEIQEAAIMKYLRILELPSLLQIHFENTLFMANL